MEIILFTKILKGCSIEEVGAAARHLGVAGLDLAVRSGQCVAPDNVTRVLPNALRVWCDFGLTVPMVTLEGNAINPNAKEVQDIYAACAAADVRLVKLGYWLWQPGDDYWQGVAQIRRALEGFQKLGEQFNIRSLLHTHSDNYISLTPRPPCMSRKDSIRATSASTSTQHTWLLTAKVCRWHWQS